MTTKMMDTEYRRETGLEAIFGYLEISKKAGLDTF
jgi:23S rRNA maturation mini-RNase III